MDLKTLKELFQSSKETSLYHRYITNDDIIPLIQKHQVNISSEIIGKSVLDKPIYGLQIGNGEKRILMWSQMHGNESTTTKAIFDILNTLSSKKLDIQNLLDKCTLYIIPILNPDGAEAYTRVNANNIDLNRDAQDLSQPESNILRKVFEQFRPHFCYNLHGQRTIFSAGEINKSAVVSFLAPAQDEVCTVTPNRKVAMEVISEMNSVLQNELPEMIGVYDDAFNLDCVGDTFQSKNIPTILFEAGHFPNDYGREITRKYIYISILKSLDYIANYKIEGRNYKNYFDIPENKKLFLDIIIRNASIGGRKGTADIGIQYQEKLENKKIVFVPKVERIGDLPDFFGHIEYDAKNNVVSGEHEESIRVGYENDFVIWNNEKISLLPK